MALLHQHRRLVSGLLHARQDLSRSGRTADSGENREIEPSVETIGPKEVGEAGVPGQNAHLGTNRPARAEPSEPAHRGGDQKGQAHGDGREKAQEHERRGPKPGLGQLDEDRPDDPDAHPIATFRGQEDPHPRRAGAGHRLLYQLHQADD